MPSEHTQLGFSLQKPKINPPQNPSNFLARSQTQCAELGSTETPTLGLGKTQERFLGWVLASKTQNGQTPSLGNAQTPT